MKAKSEAVAHRFVREDEYFATALVPEPTVFCFGARAHGSAEEGDSKGKGRAKACRARSCA